MTIVFSDVKTILDRIIGDWEVEHGRAPQLSTHSDNFGWSNRAQLLNSTARGRRLIQPEFVGSADASEANLIRVLTNGLPFVPRMPAGGPFLSDEEILTIKTWIESGAPE
ncbi:cytochrome c [Rhizobium sp. J15]|uniref:c-type cytochrome n=1 Tax=Rhizobium sp. J15 TaxID=2035450 RepID=UPI001141947B|nr:cytochrome c [Rhizobium sp. J15]